MEWDNTQSYIYMDNNIYKDNSALESPKNMSNNQNNVDSIHYNKGNMDSVDNYKNSMADNKDYIVCVYMVCIYNDTVCNPFWSPDDLKFGISKIQASYPSCLR